MCVHVCEIYILVTRIYRVQFKWLSYVSLKEKSERSTDRSKKVFHKTERIGPDLIQNALKRLQFTMV